MTRMSETRIQRIDSAGESAQETAIELAIGEKTSLIITDKHSYTPSHIQLCKVMEHGTVFIVETTDLFKAVTENISQFQRFIIVNIQLNLFEEEFFRQLSGRLHKEFVYIGSIGADVSASSG